MLYRNRWMVVAPIIAGLHLAGCHTKAAKPVKIKPAVVERVEGSSLGRLTLTAKAAQRLDIQTTPVSGSVIPYAAVLYGLHGETWTYTNPEPLVFVREPIVIDHIEGDSAFLSEGPDTGTAVVIIGVAELYGAEVGIKK